jgi:hypothetical protein
MTTNKSSFEEISVLKLIKILNESKKMIFILTIIFITPIVILTYNIQNTYNSSANVILGKYDAKPILNFVDISSELNIQNGSIVSHDRGTKFLKLSTNGLSPLANEDKLNNAVNLIIELGTSKIEERRNLENRKKSTILRKVELIEIEISKLDSIITSVPDQLLTTQRLRLGIELADLKFHLNDSKSYEYPALYSDFEHSESPSRKFFYIILGSIISFVFAGLIALLTFLVNQIRNQKI